VTRFSVVLLAVLLSFTCPAFGEEPAGETVEYDYDGHDVSKPELAWFARAYVPSEAIKAHQPAALVVMLHGVNKPLAKYPWMGGGTEPDLRPLISQMIATGSIAPTVIAAPSSIVPEQVAFTSFARFDLDQFLKRTFRALDGKVTVDRSRIIVVGHSGAGCNSTGGLASRSKRRLHAVLAVDTCMYVWLGTHLGKLPGATNVVVTYQTATWADRAFDAFSAAFFAASSPEPERKGLRIFERFEPAQNHHIEIVPMTLERWLPRLLAPVPIAEPGADSGMVPPSLGARQDATKWPNTCRNI
jgi:hypothetical protein